MEKMSGVGTGESYCRIKLAIRVEANNTPVTQIEAAMFARYAWKKTKGTDEEVFIEFSERRTSNRWGTAWCRQRRLTLYRHSVAVFLHELAHLLCADREGHGPTFGAMLDNLYLLWNMDEGVAVRNLARRLS